MVKQLVTDFGRTRKLVISSSLHARAEQENIVTARANALLQVGQSYYEVLEAQWYCALRRKPSGIGSSFLIKWPRLRATSSGLTWMLVLQTWIWIKPAILIAKAEQRRNHTSLTKLNESSVDCRPGAE